MATIVMPSVFIDGEEVPDATIKHERDYEEVRSISPERDPDWSYTDSHGHTHRYVELGDQGDGWGMRLGVPETLVRVVDYTYWCEDCRDEHEASHLECRECGDTVEPGTRPPSMFPRYIARGDRYTIIVPVLIEDGPVEVSVEGDGLSLTLSDARPVSATTGTDGSETVLEAYMSR